MSLINCPVCGKEVSSEAEICPNCGQRLQKIRVVPSNLDFMYLFWLIVSFLASLAELQFFIVAYMIDAIFFLMYCAKKKKVAKDSRFDTSLIDKSRRNVIVGTILRTIIVLVVYKTFMI